MIPKAKPGPRKKGQRDPIVGQTIGFFKVLTRLQDRKTGAPNTRARVLCLCTGCGNRKVVTRAYLLRQPNPIQHCGCQDPKVTSHKCPIEYSGWAGMIARCTNPKHPSWPEYGARGIKVCDRWADRTPHPVQGTPIGFLNFYEDMGPRPKDHPKEGPYSLDRINPDGNYEPGNLKWSTATEQARNKRNTKWVKHPVTGKPIKAADLADELKIPYQTLRNRMIEEGTW